MNKGNKLASIKQRNSEY